MKSEIVEAFSQLAREKNIDKEVLSQILQEIFLTMIRKKFGQAENFDIFVNMEKGEIEIYQYKTIVEEVEDPVTQIPVDVARALEPDLELGDEFMEIVNPSTFGRRLIISAKQNLNQKIKEIEKELIFNEFNNRIGEIISGDIRQINRDEIYLNVDKTEVVLPKNEQIPTERYHRGDHVRAVIKEVVKSARGPEIIVSRSSPLFLVRLFELEVPEISDGIIEIKRIAREAGERSKIAVYSNDKRIDAVGACVGMKGMRIQAIVKELNNEKIDIINWSSEPEIFITRALSPAKPLRIAIDEEAHKVIAVIDDEQISLAIGKGGQNRRLAAKLTDYDIQTVREDEYDEMMRHERDEEMSISDIEALSDKLKSTLVKGGFETVQDIAEANIKSLMALPNIGEKTAIKIKETVQSFLTREE
ncbi:MAG TPA: transcription termination factor NusA [bacterium]|nr:transcription termination factor NusA [bacterium]HNT66131.1 transcription termination factor NusA [bacterium]HOX87059.1 transcription termination factor NusA [bacterium]HPG46390.1 transcription termination factor NusA [bacterium]HPM98696.1 transcription termination factor NusA [bacterium]